MSVWFARSRRADRNRGHRCLRISGLAEQGDATPQDEAEAALKRYRSLPHDTEELRRYRKAAEEGDASAQFDLAEMYHQFPSVGRAADLIDRYLWYPKAAEADKWYRKAAKQGHMQAQIRLGEMYFHGEGMLKDYDEAVRWYRMAAEQGHIDTQLKVAGCYEEGFGVAQDYAEAAKWYRKAAEQGDEAGQLLLGKAYEAGQGMSQNYVLAHMWFNLSASQVPIGMGRTVFVENRDRVAVKMTPQQIAEAQRLAREWKPKTWAELQQSGAASK